MKADVGGVLTEKGVDGDRKGDEALSLRAMTMHANRDDTRWDEWQAGCLSLKGSGVTDTTMCLLIGWDADSGVFESLRKFVCCLAGGYDG